MIHPNLYVLAVAFSLVAGGMTGLFTWAVQKTWGRQS